MQTFDDARLVRLAKSAWYRPGLASEFMNLEPLLHKDALNNKERNELLAFLEASKGSKPMSMSQMKTEILKTIKYENSNDSYTNTVSREELEAIYNFITRQK